MNLHQKIYAIVRKADNEIINYSTAQSVIESEWRQYYEGEEDEEHFFLQQTFKPISEIKSDLGI